MTEFRTRAFAGIVGMTLAGLMSIGCSSNNNNGTGTAGSTGTAGTTPGAGNAGTTGHAGTTGSAGTSGTGTAGTSGAGCPAPTTKTVRDFSTDASAALSSGTPYTFQDTGLTAPTVDTSTGALKVTLNTGVASTMYPYAGVGVPFDACADLSTSTGVKFNISGTLNAPCTIQFSLIDEKHSNSKPLGMCGTTATPPTSTDSCYPGGKVFTLPSAATDVTINFADIPQGGTGGDTTVAAVVPSLATGVQWQLNVPTAEAGSGCTGNFTISNVSLVP